MKLLYGELGHYPISLNAKLKIIIYWFKLITRKHTELSFLIYELLMNDYNNGICEHKWLKCIRSVTDEIGYSNL